MDTSREYIEMCDCEEIQNLWEREEGDYFGHQRYKGVEIIWIM